MFEERVVMAQGSTKVRKRSSGVVVPNQPRWFQRLGAFIISCTMRVYVFSLRIRWDDSGNPRDQINGPTIYCLWHNRLILCVAAYRQHARTRPMGKGMAGLVSASKDGAFLAAILERFKIQPVRGSSSRRGSRALLELTSWAEEGYDLAITPDGPRGPKYIVQPGAMSLAQLTGLPIVPFGFQAQRKIQLKSWDAFQIPLPFSRCVLRMGAPIRVAREATDEQREELRLQLEKTLKTISPD
jgi:lysophospholipid acyltransferase (LPLAT)-like uncharacterized protein